MSEVEKSRIHAKTLTDIITTSLDGSGSWPRSISGFSKVLKDYINHMEGPPKQETVENGLNEHQIKELVRLEKQVVRGALPKKKQNNQARPKKKRGSICQPENSFRKALEYLDIGSFEEKCLWLYQDMAEDYSIFMPNIMPDPKDYPISPRRWMTSDSPDDLDIGLSYSKSPIIIPNVTTYRWEYGGISRWGGNVKPDLLLAIDSSRSMPNPLDKLSFPVLSAMIAARSALSMGNYVGVINFSKNYRVLEFTREGEDIDREIMLYHGECTSIPGEEMYNLVKDHKRCVHTMIISDAEIHNLYDVIDDLDRVYTESKAGGTLILCCESNDKARELEDLGYSVSFSRNFDELGRLTIKRSKELYAI